MKKWSRAIFHTRADTSGYRYPWPANSLYLDGCDGWNRGYDSFVCLRRMRPNISCRWSGLAPWSVCHGREQAEEEFFYMYMCHFLQLHLPLPFDDFTMGVLPFDCSWGYLQAFRLLCRSLYLHPSLEWLLYFYDTRLKDPITRLSLVSRPGICILDAFSQSFKHFKDDFFKVVVKPACHSFFYDNNGCTKFPFYWTDNQSCYKGTKKEELSMEDRQIMKVLEKFSNKLPTKGLVRVYLSVNPLVDLQGIFTMFAYFP